MRDSAGVPPPGVVLRFGPFELDPASGCLFHGRDRVPLSEPQSAILVCLVTHAGHIADKDTLLEAAWGKQAVTYYSLAQAISRLRKALGQPVHYPARSDVEEFIETVPNRGYRFAAPVERTERHELDASPEAALAPYRAFVTGRAYLHSLNRESIARARTRFEDVLRTHPNYAPAHVGLANACALIFEATRIDPACDLTARAHSLRHARRGRELAPASGDAWSTLALALFLHGETTEAGAAAYKAIDIEPDEWHHWLRLAFISWGGDRIRAARRVLTMCPDLALAHWLIATVLIARGAFDAALDVLQEGCAAQDAQSTRGSTFPAVGLHLLRGLVLGARQRLDAAAEALTHELTSLDTGQMYARECAANTWYALGAIRLRQQRRDDAEAAFAGALKVAPAHFYTRAALGLPLLSLDPGDPRLLDAALARAAGLARAGRHREAAQAWQAAVSNSPLPAAGWTLGVDQLIDAGSHSDFWNDTLAIVRLRAM